MVVVDWTSLSIGEEHDLELSDLVLLEEVSCCWCSWNGIETESVEVAFGVEVFFDSNILACLAVGLDIGTGMGFCCEEGLS